MKNKQGGQALVEFIIILPILILLIFSFIDLGRIILENNRLENLTNIVIDKYEETNDIAKVKSYLKTNGYMNIDVNITNEENTLKIKLTKKVDIITPGLNNIIDNPYKVEVKRVINYEE